MRRLFGRGLVTRVAFLLLMQLASQMAEATAQPQAPILENLGPAGGSARQVETSALHPGIVVATGFDSDAEVYRSIDAGVRWASVELHPYLRPRINVLHASANGVLYAGTTRGLFVSHDFGAGWERSDFATARNVTVLDIASATADPDAVWVLCAYHEEGQYDFDYHLLYAADVGAPWHDLSPQWVTSDAWSTLAIDEGSVGVVLGGADSKGVGIIHRSRNAGLTWARSLVEVAGRRFGDVHSLQFIDGQLFASMVDGNSSALLQLGTDQDAWRVATMGGLPVPLVNAIARRSPDELLAASRGGLLRSDNEGLAWSRAGEGASAMQVTDIANLQAPDRWVLATTPWGLRRSEATAPLQFKAANHGIDRFDVVAASVDPNNPGRVAVLSSVAQGETVALSRNGGLDWIQLPSPVIQTGHDWSTLLRFSPRGELFFAPSWKQFLFRWTGEIWVPTGFPSGESVAWLGFGKSNPDNMYLWTNHYFARPKFWRSEDGGRSWNHVHTADPALRLLDSDVIPTAAGDVIVARFFRSDMSDEAPYSIAQSRDGGLSWLPVLLPADVGSMGLGLCEAGTTEGDGRLMLIGQDIDNVRFWRSGADGIGWTALGEIALEYQRYVGCQLDRSEKIYLLSPYGEVRLSYTEDLAAGVAAVGWYPCESGTTTPEFVDAPGRNLLVPSRCGLLARQRLDVLFADDFNASVF